MWIPHLPQLQPNTNHPQFPDAPPNQKESKCRMRPKDLEKFNIDKKMFEQSPGKKHKKKEPCIYMGARCTFLAPPPPPPWYGPPPYPAPYPTVLAATVVVLVLVLPITSTT